ncbi:calcium-dependent phosphotriesterase [Hypoxylon rubiginosum]|uniref:Calcium-dependent phosphotriesterase n=1 Tax=Hypoxylon rubiginosum TaxID=110542 RepID=A0ACB9YQ69_9PEZI|nr:calcium-dependent phosphotriesterase [Hypoxylon rubiginosum]
MAVKAAIFVVLLAAFLPILYDAFQIVPMLWQNAPGRLASINTFKSYELKFADKARSCEDGLLIESKGIAILSCDPGREKWNTVMGVSLPGPISGAEIYAYDYKDSDAPDSDSLKRFEILGYEPGSDLHTLGMEYHEETSTLFVANHRSSGPVIEMFKLDFAALTARHFRTIRHPLLHGPNSLALINDHELLVTNDHHFLALENPMLAKMETYLNLPLGTVVHVDFSPILKDPTSAVNAKVAARFAFPNGIEILNATTVAVASTVKRAVYLYELVRPGPGNDTSSSSSPALKYKSTIRFPFMVDNIQAASDGSLFAAGHPYPFTLEKFSHTRHLCNSPADLAAADPEARAYCETASSASWVSKWTEAGGVEHLYAGSEYPTSCTAAFDAGRNVGIVTGLYAKGILVWRE